MKKTVAGKDKKMDYYQSGFKWKHKTQTLKPKTQLMSHIIVYLTFTKSIQYFHYNRVI